MKERKSDIFRQAKAELKSAEVAISLMKEARTFDEFEAAWKNYLTSIEKCWIKVEGACQHKRNKFQPWQGQFITLRKKDMLLRYIKHARNADQHTIQESVEHIPGRYSFMVPGGESVYIHSLKTGSDGKVTDYIGTKPIQIIDIPARIELLPVKDRGDWYNPPTQHLNTALQQRDPISVAKKGLEFYSQLLREAEEKFAD